MTTAEATLVPVGSSRQTSPDGNDSLRAGAFLLGLDAVLGYLPRPELERHFARAWVQAVPARWAESFGLIAAEAMMRGTAVVASRTGGLPEYIGHGKTGLLVPPGDARALADALLSLLRERSLAEEMGQRARQVALATLSDQGWVDHFVDFYGLLYRRRRAS